MQMPEKMLEKMPKKMPKEMSKDMIGQQPHLMCGKVMHARLFPKKNRFTYGIYYLGLPLSHLNQADIAYNRFAPLSFYDRDHGECDGSDLDVWARNILDAYGIEKADGEVTLVCMPRVMGYVFNPVSFWVCHDRDGDVRAVICEVHNTFGERHSYLCAHADQRPITHRDVMEGDKVFHVSPFLEREGHYSFRFDFRDAKFAALIDFYDGQGNKQLVTSLTGDMIPMTRKALRRVFWRYPLVTFKAITLIHWQAIKLLAKGIKYIPKPVQKDKNVSAARNLTEI